MNTRSGIVALSAVALVAAAVALASAPPQPSAARRRYINLPNRPVQAPFSDAVQVGNMLYLAGRIGIDPKTGQAPVSRDAEIRLLLDGFKQTLAAAGMTADDLVYVTVYCPDLSLYDQFNAAYRATFTREFPARAFIGSGSLLRGGHFEMQAIAVKE